MVLYFVFILMLLVYDTNYIITNNKVDKKGKTRLFILYGIIVVFAVGTGIYYYLNLNGNSLLHHVIHTLNLNI